MSEVSDLGFVLVEKNFKLVADFITHKSVLWEEILRLHLKPRPTWCPIRLWAKLVSLVLVQSSERRTP